MKRRTLFLALCLVGASASAETRLPSNVTIITREQIDASRAQNLSEVLDGQPGLQVIRTGTFGSFAIVKMRGAPDSSQVNILMNGIPLAGASQQFIDISQIPTENIDHIEIIEGAASALYPGDVSGGVINIVTRKPESATPDSNLRGQDRSKGTQWEEIDFMDRGNRFGGGASYGRFRTNGFQENAYSNLDSFDGLLQYNHPQLGEIEAEATIWDGIAGNPEGTPVDISQWNGKLEEEATSEYTHTEETTKTGRLTDKLRWSPDVYSEFSFFALQRDFRTMNMTGDVPPDYAERDSLVQTQLNVHLSNGLTAGGSYQSDNQSAQGATLVHHDDHLNGFIVHSHTFGIWSEILRLESEDDGQYGLAVNPRVTLMADPTSWLTFSSNVGHSRRIPSFTERFYQYQYPTSNFSGNDGLIPEKTWTCDIGVQIHASSTTLRATGFYTHTDDRITIDPTQTTFINSGLSEQEGVEGSFTYAWRKFDNEAAATYVQSEGEAADGSGMVALQMTPRLTANDKLTYNASSRWTYWARVRYMGDQYSEDNSQGTLIPHHTVYDFEIIRRIFSAELFVRVENVLDTRYAESTGFDPRLYGTLSGVNLSPQMPRSFWAGVNIHFTD